MSFNLIDELFQSTPEDKRCPYIRKDNIGPYCSINLKENESASPERRYSCDPLSLQLWCLDKNRCSKCLFYDGELFKK